LTNCLVAGNTARYGGGLHLSLDAVATLINSTVADNEALYTGGGIYNEYYYIPAGVHFKNCIVWGNTPNQIRTDSGSTTAVAYSCVEGGHAGPGNISDDPQFRHGPSGSWTANATYDAATGQTTFTDTNAGWVEGELIGKTLNPDIAQYRQSLIVGNTVHTVIVWGDFAALGSSGRTYQVHDYAQSPCSPVIDAANNGFLPPDTYDLNTNGDTSEPIPFDLDGNPRIAWCDVDMGAYEYQGPFGDRDENCEVDLYDFAGFQQCFAPGGPVTTGCDAFDFDLDDDVDLEDFGCFEKFFARP
jgi:hypothetical protein